MILSVRLLGAFPGPLPLRTLSITEIHIPEEDRLAVRFCQCP